MKQGFGVFLLTVLLGISPAWAAPFFVYEGSLTDSSGTPIGEGAPANVPFTLEILGINAATATRCVLYRESRYVVVDKGNFIITVGQGASTVDQPLSFETIFGEAQVSGLESCSFDPSAAGSYRALGVTVDSSFLGDVVLAESPRATVAGNAQKLEGLKSGSFFRVKDSGGAIQSLSPWLVDDYQKLTNLVANTTISGGNASIGGTASGFTGSLAGDVTGGQGTTKVERLQGRSVLNTAPADGQVLSWNHANSRWEPKTPVVAGITSINGSTGASQTFTTAQSGTAPAFSTAGNTHTLNIPLASGATVTSGTISHADYQSFSNKQAALGFMPLNPANNLNELANLAMARTNLGLGTAATKSFGTSSGNLVELDGSGKIPAALLPSQADTYFKQGGNAFGTSAALGTTDSQSLSLQTAGSSRVTISASGNVGIGTTTPSEKLEVGGKVKATELCIGVDCRSAWPVLGGGGTVTSVTAGAGLTGGMITTTGTIGLGTELSGLNALGTTGFVKRTGAGTYSTSASLDLSSDVTGILPIAQGGTGAVSQSAAINALLPSQTSQAGKVLGTNGTAASWVPASNGTVTSVGVSVPSYMTSAGGPITTSGTIALGFGSQAANTVFAAPLASAGAPGFRTLRITDIKSSVAGNFLTGASCNSNQALVFSSVSDTISCQTISGTTPAGAAGGDLAGTYPNPTIANGAVTDAKIASMAAAKLTGVLPAANFPALTGDVTTTAGSLATSVVRIQGRAVANAAPTNGQVLKWNNTLSQWEPGADNNAVGTVTSVTSANADISVANTTTTPVLTLNSGTGTNQILKLDASAQIPAVSGALLTNLNASNLATGSIPGARIAAGTITSAHIVDGAVGSADLANGAVTDAKVTNLDASKITTGTLDPARLPSLVCPSGFTRITPGYGNSFCISSGAAYGLSTFLDAAIGCGSAGYETCSMSQLRLSCAAGVTSPSQALWANVSAGSYGAYFKGDGGCGNFASDAITQTKYYRCCLQ